MLSKSVYLSAIVIVQRWYWLLQLKRWQTIKRLPTIIMEDIIGTIIMENIAIIVSRLATTTAMAATPTVIAKC